MSNPLIHESDYYVVLEPSQPERILTAQETLCWLQQWLGKLDEWPEDLRSELSIDSAANRLLDTSCDLELQPGISIQWFAVRIDPPDL